MPGANYVLAKGFLATGGSVAYSIGNIVKLTTASTLQPAQVVKTSSQGEAAIGVVIEDLDAAKVATAKAYVGVQILGIALVKCTTAASITLGGKVTTSTTAGAEVAATGDFPLGIAMNVPAADGDLFHVLLTPGAPALA